MRAFVMPPRTVQMRAEATFAGLTQGPDVTSGYGGPISQTREPMLSAALSDLDTLTSMASQISGSLYETRQRVFGPWAQAASQGANGIEPTPPSQEAQLSAAISRLRGLLLEIRDNASAIGSQL